MSFETGRMKGDLKVRTKEFALAVVRLYSDLPTRREAQIIGDQILRSGTSVGAHFREAQRAKSKPDFISKIEGGMQESEETVYWLELLEETGFATLKTLGPLKGEADELMAIFVIIEENESAVEKIALYDFSLG